MEIKSSKTLVDEALAQIKTLTTTEVKELMKGNKCILVDIRDIRELWNEGSIKDAIHIPRGMLEFWLDPLSPYFKKYKFDSKKEIVFFCAAGMRSALATKSLIEMGYKNVAHIAGGFSAMKFDGFDVVEETKD